MVQSSHVIIYHKNEGYFNRFHIVECDRSIIIDVNTWHKPCQKAFLQFTMMHFDNFLANLMKYEKRIMPILEII